MPQTIDAARVGALTQRIMGEIVPELSRQPPARENVFVVLNGLAIAAGIVLAGCVPEAREFFADALENALAFPEDAG